MTLNIQCPDAALSLTLKAIQVIFAVQECLSPDLDETTEAASRKPAKALGLQSTALQALQGAGGLH